MKTSIIASMFVCGLVADVASATNTRRGATRGQVERRMSKKESNGNSKSSKKKGSGKGGDYFFLALPCADTFGDGGDGFSTQREQSCLTYTAGQGFDSRITDQIEYDPSIGARCCGSTANPGLQQWRFNEVNEFFTTVQNKASGLCLRAPVDCSVGFFETEDEVFNGAYPGAGECDEGNDLYLWSVADMQLTSKACSAEGSISRDLSFYGCTDGFATIPGPNCVFCGIRKLQPSYYGGSSFVASKLVGSFAGGRCESSVCSLDGPFIDNCPGVNDGGGGGGIGGDHVP